MSLAQVVLINLNTYQSAHGLGHAVMITQLFIGVAWALNVGNDYIKTPYGKVAYALGSVIGAGLGVELAKFIWTVF